MRFVVSRRLVAVHGFAVSAVMLRSLCEAKLFICVENKGPGSTNRALFSSVFSFSKLAERSTHIKSMLEFFLEWRKDSEHEWNDLVDQFGFDVGERARLMERLLFGIVMMETNLTGFNRFPTALPSGLALLLAGTIEW